MNDDADANWWEYDLDRVTPDKRSELILRKPGYVEVNPPSSPPADQSRRNLSYSTYLKLDVLLGAQCPATTVPEERIFVITHQLFELVFKQMIFDLHLVERALDSLIKTAPAAEPPIERRPTKLSRNRSADPGLEPDVC